MEEKKKNGKGKTITIIVLVLIIIGMSGYIAYDKGAFDSLLSKKDTKEEKKEEVKDNANIDENKELDFTKCLNASNSNVVYSEATETSDYGLSMQVNSDKKSITLKIDWSIFGPLTGSTSDGSVKSYQVTNFTKDISEAFVGTFGLESKGITLFYLMNDKTVEYTPMFIKETDSKGNNYYSMNYTYEYSSDNRVTGEHFETDGIIKNVDNIIKLSMAKVSENDSTSITTIAVLKDGSFYDLNNIINN